MRATYGVEGLINVILLEWSALTRERLHAVLWRRGKGTRVVTIRGLCGIGGFEFLGTDVKRHETNRRSVQTIVERKGKEMGLAAPYVRIDSDFQICHQRVLRVSGRRRLLIILTLWPELITTHLRRITH